MGNANNLSSMPLWVYLDSSHEGGGNGMPRGPPDALLGGGTAGVRAPLEVVLARGSPVEEVEEWGVEGRKETSQAAKAVLHTNLSLNSQEGCQHSPTYVVCLLSTHGCLGSTVLHPPGTRRGRGRCQTAATREKQWKGKGGGGRGARCSDYQPEPKCRVVIKTHAHRKEEDGSTTLKINAVVLKDWIIGSEVSGCGPLTSHTVQCYAKDDHVM
ncbi:hypothetical protein EYF80_008974 [Liparis tanakae]|uniref:Uncharacterized protein n=1 Tax=Liparis tanakae TaxID=230148 RepID=A0A4Z2IRU5_9TELE|nr:hypothetical protein EYF80_008974 [Liparis tanakae]